MSKMTSVAVAASAVLMASHAWAAPQPSEVQTTIQIANTTTSAQAMTQKQNISGTLSPAAPTSIPAETTYSATSTTYETSDAGVLYYGNCKFNWSTIWNLGSFADPSNGSYTFSAAATPAADCTVTTLQATVNGQHSVKFTITH